MSYEIREMLLTIQGEGFNAGQVVVLCRFSGCNLSCAFCDTDHEGTDGPGGGSFSNPGALVAAAERLWQGSGGEKMVLLTGGEPLLQIDAPLLRELKKKEFRILLETNGTLPVPSGVDWVCVSPKEEGSLAVSCGSELKLPYMEGDRDPSGYLDLDFDYFYLQPVWDDHYQSNLQAAVSYCMGHPLWRLSLQTHRYAGFP